MNHGDPPHDSVKEKYPSAWRDEISINVVLHSRFGQTYLSRGIEPITFTPNRNDGLRFGMNDKIGLVLNLDYGTLSMYKNEIYVGKLCSGLEGEYLWVGCISGGYQTSISISDTEYSVLGFV